MRTRLTWRTADDHRCCFRSHDSAASRLAQPDLDRRADDPVGCVDLLAADYPDRRCSDLGPPAGGPWAHRGRSLARPREHRAGAEPTPRDLAGNHDPVHALVRCRLERGNQWRLSHGGLTPTVAAV